MKKITLTSLHLKFGLAALLALLLALDAILIPFNGRMPFFYAGFGFCATIAFIALAKLLGRWLRRPETYYREKE